MRVLAIGVAAGAVVVLTAGERVAIFTLLLCIPLALASYRGFREHVLEVVPRPARAKRRLR